MKIDRLKIIVTLLILCIGLLQTSCKKRKVGKNYNAVFVPDQNPSFAFDRTVHITEYNKKNLKLILLNSTIKEESVFIINNNKFSGTLKETGIDINNSNVVTTKYYQLNGEISKKLSGTYIEYYPNGLYAYLTSNGTFSIDLTKTIE